MTSMPPPPPPPPPPSDDGDAPPPAASRSPQWIWIVGIVVVVLVVGAVYLLTRGDGGGQVGIDQLDPEEQAVAASLSQALGDPGDLRPGGGALGGGLGGLGGGDGVGLSPQQTECIAAGVVSDLGVDRLAELGVTAEGVPGDASGLEALTREEREQVADRALDCVDLEALMTEALAGQGVDPEVGRCILGELGEDTIKEFLVLALGGEEVDLETNPELGQRLMGVFLRCMPEDLEFDLGG